MNQGAHGLAWPGVASLTPWRMESATLQKALSQVVERGLAMNDDRDTWAKAPLLLSVYRHGTQAQVEEADRILASAILRQTATGQLNLNDTLHFSTPFRSSTLPGALGYAIMERHRQSPDSELLHHAALQADAILAAPRTADGAILSRDHPRELHFDFVFMIAPLLAAVGLAIEREDYVDEAYLQIQRYFDHLIDPLTGLGRRSWCDRPDSFPRSLFWSRGSGWAAIGALEVLATAPRHEAAPETRHRVVQLIKSVSTRQDANGLWRDTLDDAESHHESAGSAMHAYAILSAMSGSMLPAGEYQRTVDRALAGLLTCVTSSGEVTGVVLPGSDGKPSFGPAIFAQGMMALLLGSILGRERGD